jgi:hypothetical protein
LAGSTQFHLAVLAELKGKGMFDEESYRADVHCLEEGNLADAHVQTCLGLDAPRAPALPTRLRRYGGDDGEPPELERG